MSFRKVHERLERTADAAEQDNQRLAVSALSAQQLRAAEVRAKIGRVGSYAAPKAFRAGEGTLFAVNFIFSGGQRERFTFGATDPVPLAVIERGGRAGQRSF